MVTIVKVLVAIIKVLIAYGKFEGLDAIYNYLQDFLKKNGVESSD